jgi:ubiquinone/menaquinone biosynthesis C-methylase UbiE
MPFANASFDFLICRVSLPYMPIRPSLQEFHRVLTPGGGVWIVLNSIDVPRQRLMESLRKGQLKDVLFQLYVMGNGLVFHLFGTILRFPAGHGRWESCQTVSGTERALEAAGFSSIAVHRAGRAIVCSANKRAGG